MKRNFSISLKIWPSLFIALLSLILIGATAVGNDTPGTPETGFETLSDQGIAATLYSTSVAGTTNVVQKIEVEDTDGHGTPVTITQVEVSKIGGTATANHIDQIAVYVGGVLFNSGSVAAFPVTLSGSAVVAENTATMIEVKAKAAAGVSGTKTILFQTRLFVSEGASSGIQHTVADTGEDTIEPAAPADTIGVFRGTPWYLDKNGDVAWNGAVDITYGSFGIAEDRPIAGDWNGDGYDEIGVYRPSTQMWYLDYNGNGAWDPGVDGELGPWGIPEDRPIAGDWDGDGSDEFGVYRPSTQMWYLDNGNGVWNAVTDTTYGPFGISEDRPVAGDWAGNGSDEFGVFRPSTGFFYLDFDGNGGWNGAVDKSYDFNGASGDLPVAGDWDGDGTAEIGVYRPSTQMWYLDSNGNGALDAGETFGPFGVSSDRPIAGRWQNGVGVGPSSVPMSMVSSPVVLVMPNPVTVGGEVTFQVMGAGIDALQVSIYDLGGGLVYQSELVSGQSVTWDLRFEEGTPVANGIYLYAVTAKAYGELISTKVGKLLILR